MVSELRGRGKMGWPGAYGTTGNSCESWRSMTHSIASNVEPMGAPKAGPYDHNKPTECRLVHPHTAGLEEWKCRSGTDTQINPTTLRAAPDLKILNAGAGSDPSRPPHLPINMIVE
jgi:hypothetical protein